MPNKPNQPLLSQVFSISPREAMAPRNRPKSTIFALVAAIVLFQSIPLITQTGKGRLRIASAAGRAESNELVMWMGLTPLKLNAVVAGRSATAGQTLRRLRLPEWLGDRVNVQIVTLTGRTVLRQSNVAVDSDTRSLFDFADGRLAPGAYGAVITSGRLHRRWMRIVYVPSR